MGVIASGFLIEKYGTCPVLTALNLHKGAHDWQGERLNVKAYYDTWKTETLMRHLYSMNEGKEKAWVTEELIYRILGLVVVTTRQRMKSFAMSNSSSCATVTSAALSGKYIEWDVMIQECLAEILSFLKSNRIDKLEGSAEAFIRIICRNICIIVLRKLPIVSIDYRKLKEYKGAVSETTSHDNTAGAEEVHNFFDCKSFDSYSSDRQGVCEAEEYVNNKERRHIVNSLILNTTTPRQREALISFYGAEAPAKKPCDKVHRCYALKNIRGYMCDYPHIKQAARDVMH